MSLKIAMWSGPRNISTAMMRSWENRSDTRVVDEPFYGYYLAHTATPHPMQAEILASQPNEWQQVVANLVAKKQSHKDEIFYQKHMTHHMLEDIDLRWTTALTHCFLIRDPLYVVNSYVKKMPSVCSADIGIERQYQLYQQLSAITGQTIPIIDSKDILTNPEVVLTKLCQQLNIEFQPAMLQWPTGTRSSDGVWAKHWYENVESSSGFAKSNEPEINLTTEQRAVAMANRDFYLELHQNRITID